MSSAHDVLPTEADLPPGRWMAIDDGFDGATGPGGGVAELVDCVGDAFPNEAVTGTSATPHWVALDAGTPRLVHGVGVLFDGDDAADQAVEALATESFARCLAQAVIGDLAGAPGDAEVLVADVRAGPHGHRVSFHGTDGTGVRPVHLDVVLVRVQRALGIWWLADSPDPFPPEVTTVLIDAVVGRHPR